MIEGMVYLMGLTCMLGLFLCLLELAGRAVQRWLR